MLERLPKRLPGKRRDERSAVNSVSSEVMISMPIERRMPNGAGVEHLRRRKSPNTPRLSMEIEPSRVISLDNPRAVIITIHRAEDDCSDPCIFRWNFLHDGWGPSGFMLFQHTSDSLKKVEGKHKSPPPQTFKLTGYEVETEELLPGQTLRRNIGYPYPFWDHLHACFT